ncbi:SAF domain-containing protein [Saccharopolyspora sp. NPDC047091]|uniref:Flp pilus assembly protein CpaB n=1 Tax=Saccharopolyspora sp. NPDC047091 TaxID=3155924 RepID=UPI0033ED70AC
MAALLPRAPVPRGAGLLLARRVAAVALFALAGVLALLPAPGRQVRVVVAAHDLSPGRPLDSADLRHRAVPADLVPSGALRDPAAAVGRTLGGAVRDGEPLTDVRLATAADRPPVAGAEPGQVAVPVRLADPGVADLLRPGLRVDLVTPQERSGPGSVLAEQVPVLAVRPTGSGADQGRLLVVGVPEQRAATVAGASLIHSVTVTLR